MTYDTCFCTETAVVAGCSIHDARTRPGRMTETPISPDCRDGNCRKCDGRAWDDAADELAYCRCKCNCVGRA